MAITTRASKGSALTHTEMDTNLKQIPNGANSAITDTGTNVGIGTSSPASTVPLSIKTTSGQDGAGMVLYDASGAFAGAVGTVDIASKFINTASVGDLALRAETGDVLFSASGAIEKLRILSSGGITFNGDTSSANALDDYEEGTWTPVLAGYTGNTYSHQLGYYTKIGNVVTVHFSLGINSIGTYVSNSHIAGLPFSAGPTVTPGVSMQFSQTTALNYTRDHQYGGIYNGGTDMFIYSKTGSPYNGNHHIPGLYAGTLSYISY